MDSSDSRRTFPWSFFVLLLVLSLPFWAITVLTKQLDVPINLPIGALQALNPVFVAMILLSREKKPGSIRGLVARAFDFKRITHKAWYVPMVGIWPLTLVFVYGIMRITDAPLPEPVIPILMAPVFFIVFFISGTTEELGWQGYLIDRLPVTWSALTAAVVMGTAWGAWHLFLLLTTQRGWWWILWQLLGMIPFRILIVWLFYNTGKSVFAASVIHAVANVSQFLFPNYGSHYDPFLTFIVLAVVAIFAIVLWGPKTLSRFRFSREDRRAAPEFRVS